MAICSPYAVLTQACLKTVRRHGGEDGASDASSVDSFDFWRSRSLEQATHTPPAQQSALTAESALRDTDVDEDEEAAAAHAHDHESDADARVAKALHAEYLEAMIRCALSPSCCVDSHPLTSERVQVTTPPSQAHVRVLFVQALAASPLTPASVPPSLCRYARRVERTTARSHDEQRRRDVSHARASSVMGTSVAPRKTLGLSSKLKLLQSKVRSGSHRLSRTFDVAGSRTAAAVYRVQRERARADLVERPLPSNHLRMRGVPQHLNNLTVLCYTVPLAGWAC